MVPNNDTADTGLNQEQVKPSQERLTNTVLLPVLLNPFGPEIPASLDTSSPVSLISRALLDAHLPLAITTTFTRLRISLEQYGELAVTADEQIFLHLWVPITACARWKAHQVHITGFFLVCDDATVGLRIGHDVMDQQRLRIHHCEEEDIVIYSTSGALKLVFRWRTLVASRSRCGRLVASDGHKPAQLYIYVATNVHARRCTIETNGRILSKVSD